MLSTNSSFTFPGEHLHGSYKERIELSAVMEQVIREAGLRTSSFVLRCAHLPVTEGAYAAYHGVFTLIVGMITRLQQPGTSLYLHVDCMEAAPGVDAEFMDGRKRYDLRFHTSAATGADWAAVHETIFAQCREVMQGQGAQFEVFPVRNTGCLFSISLLGKL